MTKIFWWEGIDSNGQKIQGKYSAKDIKAIIQILDTEGITPLKIKKKHIKNKRKLPFFQIAEFTDYLAILLHANLSLRDSLEMILEEQPHGKMADIIDKIKKSLENGMSLAHSLNQFPMYFGDLYCGLVSAGEHSGTLAKMLTQLASHQQTIMSLKTKISKALFYPAAIAVVAIFITVGLLLFVVPQFKNIFDNFGAKLPFFTEFIINLSIGLQKLATIIFIVLAFLYMLYRILIKRYQKIRDCRDNVLLRLPGVGIILRAALTAQWTKILAILLSAEIPLNEALVITNKAIINNKIKNTLDAVMKEINAGVSFHKALSQQRGIPLQLIQIIKVGENSGQLNHLLDKAAEINLNILNKHIDYLSKWLEPVIMIILAVITGSLIIAMYLPIFKLGAAL